MAFVAPALAEMKEMQRKNKERLESILEEWRKSKKYPRKMKKKSRKHLQLDYSICKHFEKMNDGFDLFI